MNTVLNVTIVVTIAALVAFAFLMTYPWRRK
jgi:hypothetical protein